MNSVEQMYKLNSEFILPLLKFANIYTDEVGILRPMNNPDKELSYQYEGKELIIVKNNAQFQNIKDKKDDYEIFNPLLVPRHCVFLANMIMAKVSLLSDEMDEKYDEDLDEYVSENEEDFENMNTLKMFQENNDEENNIFFSYVDSNGNPKKEKLAEFSNPSVIIATIGASIILIKKFQKNLLNEYDCVEDIIDTIIVGLNRYFRLKEKEKKVIKNVTNINANEEELYDEIMEMDNIDFFIDPDLYNNPEKRMFTIFDDPSEYNPLKSVKISNNLLLPKFKLIEDEENEEENSSMIERNMDVLNYIDVDFTI